MKLTVFFFLNQRTKIHSFTGKMVCQMFRIIWTNNSKWFDALKYNIFARKCFMVTSSFRDHVNTAQADIQEDDCIFLQN